MIRIYETKSSGCEILQAAVFLWKNFSVNAGNQELISFFKFCLYLFQNDLSLRVICSMSFSENCRPTVAFIMNVLVSFEILQYNIITVLIRR